MTSRPAWIALAVVTAAALLWLVAGMGAGDRRSASAPNGEPAAEDFAEAPAEPQMIAGAPSVAAAPPGAAKPEPIQREEPPPKTELPPPEKTGPVDELSAQYAKDSRDPSAASFEQQIEAAFKNDDVPVELFKSVSCRKEVCRIETRWSPDRAIGFMSAFTRLLMIPPGSEEKRPFDSNLGISPEGEPDANGVRAVVVYLARVADAPPPAR